MTKKQKYNQLIFLLIFDFFALSAQTINLGEVAVKSDTKLAIFSDFINSTSGDFINDGELYIYRNLRNEGLFTYSPNASSSLFLNGLITQSFSGAVPLEIYNVEFNNSAAQPAFKLLTGFDIYGEANFINGILDNNLSQGAVIFQSDASANGMSDDSHVQGPVVKEGLQDFIFPIGAGGFFREAHIAEPLAASDAVTSHYFYENSNPDYPHDNAADAISFIDDKEYWSVEGKKQNNGLILTLSWNEATTSSQIIENLSADNLHIVRWDADTDSWVDEGGIVDITSKTVTTPTEVSGTGIFALALTTDILPQSSIPLDIYNALSPNGDGDNDYFHIGNLDLYPNNTVEIYNRWGVKVFETKGYNTHGNVFTGLSNGRATVNQEGKLQTGTYFYVIEYEHSQNGTSHTVKKAGYLYLTND